MLDNAMAFQLFFLFQGPLVNENQLRRVSEIVESSVNDGAKLVSGTNKFI